MVDKNKSLLPSEPVPKESSANLSRLQAILDRFEVTIAEATDLIALEDYRIVLICDDSISMQKSIHMRKVGQEDNFSRWQALQIAASVMVEIGCCFNTAGVDIFFQNRSKVPRVNGANDRRFLSALKAVPNGKQRLAETVRQVVAQCEGERSVLFLILTDGVPAGARQLIDLLAELSQKRRTASTTVKFQILAFTPEEDEMAGLEMLGSELPQVDVTNDYHIEREQVLRSGRTSTFTRGDWVLKAMLSPITDKFDTWTERKTQRGKTCPPVCDVCCVQ
mmetsp:Transcript_23377/g.53942  ORF Transcript_23377/g.53942 Transcript_23377/m.53942 type:complete len:278 (+) Transcript_23377:103-936(+)